MSFLHTSYKGTPLPVSKIPADPQYGSPIQTSIQIIHLPYSTSPTIYVPINVSFPVGEIRVKQICCATKSTTYTDIESNGILYSNLVGNNVLGFTNYSGTTTYYGGEINYPYKTPTQVSGSYSFTITDLLGVPITITSALAISVIIEFVSATSSKDYVVNVSA